MKSTRVSLFAAVALGAVLAHVVPGEAQAPRLGFFRQRNQAAVMFQYGPGLYCHVQNEDQMAAYGGFSQVQVVARLALPGRQTGDCGWPDGFYRRNNAPEVYRLHGGGASPYHIGDSICHVVNEQQMAAYGGFEQVRVVNPTSDIGRGRSAITPCPNP